ncbi:MAG: hypothetical protein FJW90_03925 [Actinobacteria bacterium]|nr:hypothetical protein [Actinomycetota bacterium]
MAASRWTERLGELPRAAWRDLRGLRGDERLVVVGVGLIAASLLLPWYGVPVAGDLVQTGLGVFGWAQGALLLMAGAALFLALKIGGGYAPPRPLREWALLLGAGLWCAAIVAYRMIDRPELDFELVARVSRDYSLRHGIFVALAGSLLIAFAGLRARAHGTGTDRP